MKWIAESYAKINLGLHVLERLPTGYHRIETGFAFINWSDRFEVEKASRWQLDIDTDDETITTGEDNLINRAIDQLKRYVDIKNAYHIKVDKRIPAGAGLGGGSSNAALTLRMLNKIEELGLSDEELIDLSRDLGADVPLFIKGQTGIGSGVGHEIKPLDIQPNFWIITCFPNVKSSTPEAYSHCHPNPEPDFDLEKTLTEADPEEWQYTLFNDLEQSVVPRHHVVGNMKDQFYEFGALYASMSGSGSAVYGLFEQDFVATNAYHGLVELEFPTNITKPGFKPDHGIYRKE
ncbi:4-(cytidine 5'-diphospho)-2-C-methyl-D-erythritol kinase [Aliifodinibius sp. S!AR15-10]|uniref:4-(cytidine 5'-diphospho)-2-C-methyl-D-erythritol kinase n=1 Tax=Aliifodinibius sp. S!AR15-10 TaxID=2950437 RepID=UPI00285B4E39|nr:4-(cytidine 5'-diphospho)-2-C-methyl-D-erythritol kinase [Aliifodinibius sp. S!AR15-10]MDR8391526.1 4-(cytidine 5'-diphospho)-2-C-methyl-D-erythritol kinase [Aliifodinibius sp. S!AR15-10]